MRKALMKTDMACYAKRVLCFILAVLVLVPVLSNGRNAIASSFESEYSETNEVANNYDYSDDSEAELMTTNGITQAQALSWVQAQEGHAFYGSYGAQCVDFIRAYYQYLGASPVSGNGCDYATNALPSGWSRIQGAAPQPADILVYYGTSDNPYGHVGIYESDYVHYDQNVIGYPEGVVRCTWHYNYSGNYWGVIRPDFYVAPSTYTLDVNGYLDSDSSAGSLGNYGTFDVYINGSRVANDVNDYCASHTAGATYAVTDIKAKDGKAYEGVYSGSRTGTLNSDVNVRLKFYTVDAASWINTSPQHQVSTYNGHTYYFYSTPTTWYCAKLVAEQLGGHLVTISSSAENNFVKGLCADGSSIWMGATDKDSEGTWKWITGESFSYNNWASGEPNNDAASQEGTENYAVLLTAGTWNDAPGCSACPFVVEFDSAYTVQYVLDNSYASGAPAAQTKAYGQALTLSSAEPTLSCHTFLGWSKTQHGTAVDYLPGANYNQNADMTLYAVWTEGIPSGWSTTKPSGVDENNIETKTQYRYSDKETKVSETANLAGYALVSSTWIKTGSGGIEYVTSWPGGFNTSSSLYSQYNNTPKTAGETTTKKTETSSSVVGYIYWHWCRNSYANGPVNRYISDCYETDFPGFHAFPTSSDASHSDPSGVYVDDCYYFYNADCCRDTYWYFRIPIYRQNYTEYTKQFTYERWGDWSDWSDTVYTAGDTRKVETRTVYRALNTGSDLHSWGEWTVQTPATTEAAGTEVRYCGKCGRSEERTVPALHKAVKIVSQPVDVRVNAGEKATVSVAAEGVGLTYAWYIKDPGASKFSKSSVTASSYSVNMTEARNGRQAYCVISDSYGNIATSATATLSIRKTLSITKQPEDVVVGNVSDRAYVSVEADGDGLTYLWYVKDPGSTHFSKTATVTDTYSAVIIASRDGRQVYCQITDEYGNTLRSATATMSVRKGLSITKQPENVMVEKAGDRAVVTVEAQGDGLTYAWYVKDAGSSSFSRSSVTTNTYAVNVTAARDGRQVYCIVIDQYGEYEISDTATLSVRVGPVITVQPQDVEVLLAGDRATATVEATGNGLTYAWYIKDPGSSKFSKSSVTTKTYAVNITAARNGRQAYCLITDADGNTAVTDTITLSIHVGPVITAQPQDVEVLLAGDRATATVEAVGNSLTYAWYIKDPSSSKFSRSSVTTNTYAVNVTAARNGRQAYCVITDKDGNTATSEIITLSIHDGPVITAQPQDVEVLLAGDRAAATVEAVGNNLTYTWYIKDPSSTRFSKSSVTTKTYAVNVTAARNGRQAYCVITDVNGNSVTSDTVILSIHVGPVITKQPENVEVLLAGDRATVKVEAVGSGLTYAWYIKDPSSSKFSKSSVTTDTYAVNVTAARNGRQAYCIVTDADGNFVKSDTVTLSVRIL